MKNIISITFLFFITLLTAQEHQISGSLKLTKEAPTSGISVLLYQIGNEVFYKAAVTDKNGAFTFSNIADGGYYIQIDATGYKQYRSEVLK